MLTEGNNVKNFLEMDIMNRQFILDGVLCWVMFYMNRKLLVLAQKKACFSVQPPSYLVNGDGQLEDLTSV